MLTEEQHQEIADLMKRGELRAAWIKSHASCPSFVDYQKDSNPENSGIICRGCRMHLPAFLKYREVELQRAGPLYRDKM